MGLLRAWLVRLVGGGAVVAVLPVVVIGAAAVVGVGGGGLAGLGTLGQTLSGPAVPTVEPAPARPDGRARRPERLLDRALGKRRARRTALRAAGVRVRGPRRRAVSPPRDRRPPRRPPSRPPGKPPATRPPAPSPSPGPTPTPGPPRSIVRRVGGTAKDVTRDVPVAGEPAGRVVDLIVETVEALPGPTPLR